MLLDEPTSQLDPVAGDELIWQLRRLNQESDTAVLLIEHRLERCLAAADRVIAMADGRDRLRPRPPRLPRMGGRAASPRCRRPAARLLDAAPGSRPPPTGVKQARATLRRHGLLPAARASPPRQPPTPKDGPLRRAWPPGAARAPVAAPALELRGVWHELRDGPAILRGVDLRIDARARRSP